MNTIFADFNAMSEDGAVRLNCLGSLEDIQAAGLQPGDWAWLSDGELIVGAQLREDPLYTIIGIPDWETLVHLDDDDVQDAASVSRELNSLLTRSDRTEDEEWRLFQLLAIFESLAPAEISEGLRPGYFPSRRAAILLFLGKPELALIEVEQARRIAPGNTNDDQIRLEILRRTDLDRAVREATLLADREETSAEVLASCVNVLATKADTLSDADRAEIDRTILDWAARFERAPGRGAVRASTLGLLQYNLGRTLVVAGRLTEAQSVFDLAREIDPSIPPLNAHQLSVEPDARRSEEIRARIVGVPAFQAA